MSITIGPEQKTKLVTLISEGSKVLQEVEDLRTGLNDTVKAIAQELDIKPTLLSKAIKIAHKQSFQEELHDFEELEAILDAVGKKS
jgi:transposase-like protein